MIADLFAPADIECLATSAAELWDGLDHADLSAKQLTTLDRASAALAAAISGQSPDRRPATILLAVDEPVWVLRFWDQSHTDQSVWLHKDHATAYLASYARANWSNLPDHTGVGAQPPADDHDAIRLFYSHPCKREVEGYALTAEPIRSAAPAQIAERDGPAQAGLARATRYHHDPTRKEPLPMTSRSVEVNYAAHMKPGDLYAGTVNPNAPTRPVQTFAAAHRLTEVTAYTDSDNRSMLHLQAGEFPLTPISAASQVLLIREGKPRPDNTDA